MHRSLLAAPLAAALLLPAAAGASTVSSAPTSGIDLTTFQAGPGPSNATLTANNAWTDSAQTLTAGANCTDDGAGTVSCPPTSDVEVYLRNAADTFTNTFYWYKLAVHGGGGADRLSGNGSATEIWGDGGPDRIDVRSNGTATGHGGTGADEIRGNFPQGNGAAIDGGDGADLLVGNSNNDKTVNGDAGQDQLFEIRGVSGTLDGGANADTLVRIGTSFIAGTITLNGGDGPDTIQGAKGKDVVSGGKGADVIAVSGDTSVDEVSCGGGVDTVYADATDVVASDCESVTIGAAPALPAVDAAKAHLAAAFPDTPQTPSP